MNTLKTTLFYCVAVFATTFTMMGADSVVPDEINDINPIDGHTRLTRAIANHTPLDVIKTLFEENPDIDSNATNAADMTPLITAVVNGETEVAKFLLTQPGIDVTIKDWCGRTALHYAINLYATTRSSEKWSPMLKVLLDSNKFDIASKDNHGFSVQDHVKWYNCPSLVKLFKKYELSEERRSWMEACAAITFGAATAGPVVAEDLEYY